MDANRKDIQPVDTDGKLLNSNESTWHWWKKLRTLCEENNKLGLVLELSADTISDEEVDRWISEPIKAVKIPTSIFLTNRSGFPVLSKPHQKLIAQFFKVNFLRG